METIDGRSKSRCCHLNNGVTPYCYEVHLLGNTKIAGFGVGAWLCSRNSKEHCEARVLHASSRPCSRRRNYLNQMSKLGVRQISRRVRLKNIADAYFATKATRLAGHAMRCLIKRQQYRSEAVLLPGGSDEDLFHVVINPSSPFGRNFSFRVVPKTWYCSSRWTFVIQQNQEFG